MKEKLSCAVIGDKSSVFGFTAVGFEVFYADNTDEAQRVLTRLGDSGKYAVIYITESLAADMSEVLAEYVEKPLPAIIPIPDRKSSGYGVAAIKKSVERAVGSDILFKDK